MKVSPVVKHLCKFSYSFDQIINNDYWSFSQYPYLSLQYQLHRLYNLCRILRMVQEGIPIVYRKAYQQKNRVWQDVRNFQVIDFSVGRISSCFIQKRLICNKIFRKDHWDYFVIRISWSGAYGVKWNPIKTW